MIDQSQQITGGSKQLFASTDFTGGLLPTASVAVFYYHNILSYNDICL